MVGTAVAILWWLVGVVIVCAVVYVVFYVLEQIGLVIPAMVKNFVYLVIGLIVLIYLITALTGQGGLSFRFGARSEIPAIRILVSTSASGYMPVTVLADK